MSGLSQFSCAACGRKYAWKAELAGKKVRCKCGQPVAVPAGEVTAAATGRSTPVAQSAKMHASSTPVMPVGQPARAVSQSTKPETHDEASHDDAPDLDGLYALAGAGGSAQQDTEALAGGIRCPACAAEAAPGAMICLTCGMNFQTGQRMKTALGVDDAPAPKKKSRGTVFQGAAPAEAAGGPRILGYAGTNPRAAAAVAKDQSESVQALMWPMIFVGLGVVGSMVYYMTGHNAYSFGTASIVLAIGTLVDMVMLFVACLIAIKLMDISLGSPAEAALKLCAVALVPGAVGGLLANAFDGGMFLGWAVSFGLYITLLMWFFSLDGSEVMMLSTIIWLIRTWAGMLVTGFLLAAVGIGAGMGGGGGGATASAPKSAVTTSLFGGSTLKIDQSPAGFENKRAEVMLTRVGSEELAKFLKRGDKYTVTGFNREESLEVIETLEDAGAIKIMTSDVKTFPDGGTVCDKLVVELPVDKEMRAHLFSIYKERIENRSQGLIQLKDNGPDQGYMCLDFDGNLQY